MRQAILGVALAAGEVREVPKLALTLEEVWFCLGSQSLVTELRDIGALVPTHRGGRTMLFDTDEVREVWARLKAGHYKGQLKQKGVFPE